MIYYKISKKLHWINVNLFSTNDELPLCSFYLSYIFFVFTDVDLNVWNLTSIQFRGDKYIWMQPDVTQYYDVRSISLNLIDFSLVNNVNI